MDRRERLLNLLAALLDTSVGLTAQELLSEPSLGYGGTGEAARKAFERDKASLRAMGVPLEQMDPERDYRYRVDPAAYYLPDLGLTTEEVAALHLAVTAISLGNRAGEGALMKLGGREGDRAQPIAVLPIAPALAPIFEATRRRAPVTFGYRGEIRDVEPWGLTSARGRWYVVGFDRDRNQMRVFRADRIDGDVTLGADGEFSVPEGFRPEAAVAEAPWQLGHGTPRPVRIAVDSTHSADLVARAGPSARVEAQADGGAIVTLDVLNEDGLRSLVLEYLEHAEILDPPEVRAGFVAWLTVIADAVAP
ncbi:MAG TPA: WYL domain-containing protein [Acidimicrobiia bacterium]|nr:WYL domain-containing protein [Acidimicrobiia bacterium]